MENEKKLQDWIISDLQRSGLSDEIIHEMDVQNVRDTDELTGLLGFGYLDKHSVLQATPVYYIPYKNACDSKPFGRVRLENAFEGIKYLSPKEGHTECTKHLYILDGEKEKVEKVNHPLVIVEGEKKTAKVVQELRKYKPEATAVGIGGVGMWVDCPEWKQIPMSCRHVYILFDSDWHENAQVQIQMIKIYLWAKKRKANVSIASFNKGKGIDDHLVECEKLGMDIGREMERLLSKSELDKEIWNTNLNSEKLADILSESYYSIEIDCKALWEEQNLSKIYKLKWATFKGSLKRAYRIKSKNKEDVTSNTIKVEGGKLHLMINKAESIIAPQNILFQRNGMMVRVLKYKKTINGKIEEHTTIHPVDAQYLIKLFTEKINWIRYSKNYDEWENLDCPRSVVDSYLSSQPWTLPLLTGIINAPTLRMDGSILQKPGYDSDTGIYYEPNAEFPIVSENPTKEDALKAMETLKTVFEEFPFVSEMDRSVAIASVLTASIRRSLRTAPLFAINAHKQGSGKSLIASIVSYMICGHEPSMISQAKTEEESRKKFLSILLVGDQIICLDNVEHPVGGEAFCTILTQPEWKERFLGHNKDIFVQTNSTFFATGNNIVIEGDMTSRTLLCSIYPQCERPEERTFNRNLGTYIPEHRVEIVQAALTILRAYHVAGRPKQDVSQYGRFEEWSDWVRSAILWLGMDDPCGSRAKIEENDPVREQIKLLFNNWYAVTKEPITISQLINISQISHKENENLKEALLIVAEGKDGIDKKKLNAFIRGIKGRWEGGKRLESCGKGTGGLTKFRVVENNESDFQNQNSTSKEKQAVLFSEE